MNSIRKTIRLIILAVAAFAASMGCDGCHAGGPGNDSAGVVIQQSGLSPLQDQTAKAVASAPSRAMNKGGLVGVLGGARVRLLTTGRHELLLPMPQLTEMQTPVCYAIIITPREAGQECRIRPRGGSNVIVVVQLEGSRGQEVKIDWSSIILMANEPFSLDRTLPEPYLKPTSCAQCEAQVVRTLAGKLWPTNGSIAGYAASIQDYIRSIKQQRPPRSLDALGILESGGNWICTANANLAVALLRSRSIAARSIAVIPPTGQRLEMHRIVAYFDGGQWRTFDPSSLQKDIPLRSWQDVVMSKTTIADENIAMKPRMGSSLGCPYGQELELLDRNITLSGRDFFWSMGKPLAEFEASDEAINLAKKEWGRFLETGKPSQKQIRAASARDSAAFLEALRENGREAGTANGSQPIGSETNRMSSAASSLR